MRIMNENQKRSVCISCKYAKMSQKSSGEFKFVCLIDRPSNMMIMCNKYVSNEDCLNKVL